MIPKSSTSQYAYRGRYVCVRIDERPGPNGGTEQREIVERIDGVRVVAVTNAGDAVLLYEFLHGAGRKAFTLPGGGIDESDPDPQAAAHRELLEETGYRAGMLRSMFVTIGSASVQQRVHYYLATKLYRAEPARSDPNTELICEVPWATASELAEKTEFADPASSLAILLAESRGLLPAACGVDPRKVRLSDD